MAVTACTNSTEYKIYTGVTKTIHPVMTTVEYDESLSGFTVNESIQCNMVLLGGNGVFC